MFGFKIIKEKKLNDLKHNNHYLKMEVELLKIHNNCFDAVVKDSNYSQLREMSSFLKKKLIDIDKEMKLIRNSINTKS